MGEKRHVRWFRVRLWPITADGVAPMPVSGGWYESATRRLWLYDRRLGWYWC